MWVMLLLGALLFLLQRSVDRRGRRSLQAMTMVPPVLSRPTSKVTIVIPARNEEQNIEACVRSLLKQSYSSFEVIVVDDNSDDTTLEVLKQLQMEWPQLQVVQAPLLPAGWSGKCWALAEGTRQATGEWLLFTDADTLHKPKALTAAVAFAESRGLDMLSLIPHQVLDSFWERAIMPAALSSFFRRASIEEVSSPGSLAATANGQFILIRRLVYEAVGGHSAVRGAVLEDSALARLVKGQGHRIMLADGRYWVRVRMYRSLGEIWEGFSKNVFFRMDSNLATLLSRTALLLALAVAPFVLLAAAVASVAARGRRFGSWLLLLLSGGLSLRVMRSGMDIAQLLGIPRRYGLLFPGGAVFFAGIMLNSAFRVLSGRGVTWKGRRYRGEKAQPAPPATITGDDHRPTAGPSEGVGHGSDRAQ